MEIPLCNSSVREEKNVCLNTQFLTRTNITKGHQFGSRIACHHLGMTFADMATTDNCKFYLFIHKHSMGVCQNLLVPALDAEPQKDRPYQSDFYRVGFNAIPRQVREQDSFDTPPFLEFLLYIAVVRGTFPYE